MRYVVGCVVGIVCCLVVGISIVNGIGGIREGVFIGWRNEGISRISVIDGICEIREVYVNDVGVGKIDGVDGIRRGNIDSWRGLFVSMCVGVINGDACGTSLLSCSGTSSLSCIFH